MEKVQKYHSETKKVKLGDKTITIINRTPILTPKEREQRKKEIEQRLYYVFSKYTKPEKNTSISLQTGAAYDKIPS